MVAAPDTARALAISFSPRSPWASGPWWRTPRRISSSSIARCGQTTGLAAVVALLAVGACAWLVAARAGIRAAAGVALLGVLLLPGVSSHSKWVLLVVLASGAIVAVSLARSEATA